MPSTVRTSSFDAASLARTQNFAPLPNVGSLVCVTLEAVAAGTEACYGVLEFQDEASSYAITLRKGWIRGDTNGAPWAGGIGWFGEISLGPQQQLVASVRNDTGTAYAFVMDYEVR